MEIVTLSPEETRNFGRKLASFLKPGDVLTLTGDLGAGKTCLTQGIGQGLKIKRAINSPTYNIIKEYQGQYPLYHFDLYRIEEEEMVELGYEEYFYGDGITVIEWPQRAGDLLPKERLEIELDKQGEEKRVFHLVPYGLRGKEIVERLEEDADIRN